MPRFFERDALGLPHAWIAMMRASMVAYLERFSTRRMLRQYAARLYGLPGFADDRPAAAPAAEPAPAR